jgi:hypothetical protein
LRRFISTPETAKHRIFVFLDATILPDNMLTNMALEDAYFLGVLSSRIHIVWTLAAGGRLGVGDDPRYTKTRCFDPFTFPECNASVRRRIRELAEKLDKHRKTRQSKYPDLTLTGIYNVLEKLRKDTPLSDKERIIHGQGLVSVLRDIHDDIDKVVFEAYGWPTDLADEQILEKLVNLNAERASEEKEGIIRWLRPEFQNPDGSGQATQTKMAGLDIETVEDSSSIPGVSNNKPWPKKLAEQITAVRDDITKRRGFFKSADVAQQFKGAKVGDVDELLEGFAALGIIYTINGKRWKRTAGRAR